MTQTQRLAALVGSGGVAIFGALLLAGPEAAPTTPPPASRITPACQELYDRVPLARAQLDGEHSDVHQLIASANAYDALLATIASNC